MHAASQAAAQAPAPCLDGPAIQAGRRALPEPDLPWVASAQVVATRLAGLEHKTLVVEFKGPQLVLSSLDGWRRGLRRAGNHYLPPEAWPCLGGRDQAQLQARLWSALGHPPSEGSLLITGADMDHLAWRRKQEQGLVAVALVTAGAAGNAMRMGSDRGDYLEPGTINILLFTNRRLSPRAMTRALITATEAKTAALQDLDIRSSFTPLAHQATGTGTDNLLVVQGQGPALEMTGGHTRMGEMLARAVHGAVREALARQNGFTASRGVAARLRERGLVLEPQPAWQQACSQPGLAGFLEQALALDDAWRRGQLGDLTAWRETCSQQAEKLRGQGLPLLKAQAHGDMGQGPLSLALEALAGTPGPRPAGHDGL